MQRAKEFIEDENKDLHNDPFFVRVNKNIGFSFINSLGSGEFSGKSTRS